MKKVEKINILILEHGKWISLIEMDLIKRVALDSEEHTEATNQLKSFVDGTKFDHAFFNNGKDVVVINGLKDRIIKFEPVMEK